MGCPRRAGPGGRPRTSSGSRPRDCRRRGGCSEHGGRSHPVSAAAGLHHHPAHRVAHQHRRRCRTSPMSGSTSSADLSKPIFVDRLARPVARQVQRDRLIAGGREARRLPREGSPAAADAVQEDDRDHSGFLDLGRVGTVQDMWPNPANLNPFRVWPCCSKNANRQVSALASVRARPKSAPQRRCGRISHTRLRRLQLPERAQLLLRRVRCRVRCCERAFTARSWR